MATILMTPEGKKVSIEQRNDVRLYDAPHNPPNTGTAYTRGTDLYAHKARSGAWYYYIYQWSMWQGEESRMSLISDDEAKGFILEKMGAGDWEKSGVDEDACTERWPDLFDEDA